MNTIKIDHSGSNTSILGGKDKTKTVPIGKPLFGPGSITDPATDKVLDSIMEYTDTPGEATMTLKEITDLLATRHNDAMNVVSRLIEKKGFGMSTKISYSYKMPNGGTKKGNTYALNKRQSLIVAAKLNDDLLGRIIDRWQELEKAALNKPKLTLVPKIPKPVDTDTSDTAQELKFLREKVVSLRGNLKDSQDYVRYLKSKESSRDYRYMLYAKISDLEDSLLESAIRLKHSKEDLKQLKAKTQADRKNREYREALGRKEEELEDYLILIEVLKADNLELEIKVAKLSK